MAVCCLDEPGSWAKELTNSGIRVSALDRKPGFNWWLGHGIAAMAAEHRANVLHAHHYSPFVYSALARLERPSLRVIFTEHGRLSDRGPSKKRRWANRVLRSAASDVFSVSSELSEHLAAEGFPQGKVRTIYNGIDVGPLPDSATRDAVRNELGVGERASVIGTIARLDPVKDLSSLLEASRLVGPSREILVVIIGDGPERASLEAQAKQSGLGAVVRFLGQRADARRWLAGCDLYVNCSTSEGVSLTILEAMAAGLPIIATSVGGTPEVVDNTCGRLVPARDPATLAESINQLMNSPTERRSLGAAARARVESRFTLDRMVAEYADVYAGRGPTRV
jgi:glycosyltransferase involved in cell wall biosynthesis